jgi:hypothetical protein
MPGCPLRRTSTRPLEGALRSKAEGELTLGLMSGEKPKRTPISCRSRLAGEKRPDTAWIQTPRVIVDVHRRQASSYNFESCEPNHRVGAGLLAMAVGQSTFVLAGRTLSPASRLLQGVYMSGMSERIREGQRVHRMSQVGFQAASAAVAVVAPSRG